MVSGHKAPITGSAFGSGDTFDAGRGADSCLTFLSSFQVKFSSVTLL